MLSRPTLSKLQSFKILQSIYSKRQMSWNSRGNAVGVTHYWYFEEYKQINNLFLSKQYPTDLFITLRLQNPSYDALELHNILSKNGGRAGWVLIWPNFSNFRASKLWDGKLDLVSNRCSTRFFFVLTCNFHFCSLPDRTFINVKRSMDRQISCSALRDRPFHKCRALRSGDRRFFI